MVIVPDGVWRARRNDHHAATLEDVLPARHAASHCTLDNFQPLFLMSVNVIARRGRYDARDILASKEFTGGLFRRLEDDHSILRRRTILRACVVIMISLLNKNCGTRMRENLTLVLAISRCGVADSRSVSSCRRAARVAARS